MRQASLGELSTTGHHYQQGPLSSKHPSHFIKKGNLEKDRRKKKSLAQGHAKRLASIIYSDIKKHKVGNTKNTLQSCIYLAGNRKNTDD